VLHRTPIRGMPSVGITDRLMGSRVFLYGGRSKLILRAEVPQVF